MQNQWRGSCWTQKFSYSPKQGLKNAKLKIRRTNTEKYPSKLTDFLAWIWFREKGDRSPRVWRTCGRVEHGAGRSSEKVYI